MEGETFLGRGLEGEPTLARGLDGLGALGLEGEPSLCRGLAGLAALAPVFLTLVRPRSWSLCRKTLFLTGEGLLSLQGPAREALMGLNWSRAESREAES